jgi:hypothetical protein
MENMFVSGLNFAKIRNTDEVLLYTFISKYNLNYNLSKYLQDNLGRLVKNKKLVPENKIPLANGGVGPGAHDHSWYVCRLHNSKELTDTPN